MGIPLWLWLVAAGFLFLCVVGGWVIYAHRAFRAEVRRRFLVHLETHHPEIQILEETPGHLRLKTTGTEIEDSEGATLFLRRLYGGAADLDLHDEEGYRQLFELWAGVILEGVGGGERDPEENRQRLMPRLVTNSFLRGVRSQSQGRLPARPLDGLGLSVVYVLDGTHSVSFVNESILDQLDLGEDEVWNLALENLRRRGGESPLPTTLEGSINVVKSGDTYDAARLLLIPEQMEPGQLVAAVIPDRDTLVLAPMPQDGDWTALKKLAKIPAGEPLLGRPLKVSREGFQIV